MARASVASVKMSPSEGNQAQRWPTNLVFLSAGRRPRQGSPAADRALLRWYRHRGKRALELTSVATKMIAVHNFNTYIMHLYSLVILLALPL